jgi:biopolymer transport protein ExbD
LQYRVIMQVMDQLKRAGIPTVGLVTEPAREERKRGK